VPREIIGSETLPRNPNGKIDRPRVHREMVERRNEATSDG
jgi:acyl-coenzyme A synthetase/AMP-(fatty) acid ligase